MPDEVPEDEADSGKVTIQPARLWPVYNVDRAKAELIAMELLTQGLSQYRVRIMTKLSSKNVRRLAGIVAEDAKSPMAPRLAGRTPARITVRSPAGRPGTAPGHTHCREPHTEAQPEQMTFPLD
ncbi:hypothetical protein [Streptomyces yaizuensis]|uniref:50S ribosomal protein L23 n=1 Tax=Streptomyces yaizuensis TaxID=2989713 RepID=A0ABQ5P6G3_9ACTN|nr:hypothetical protein [Streptomyces sp. YSPA8]GLF98075.1 hypothetical protein SYYSPA8_27280 [Streptomyces sp. YSPA8]